MIWKNPLSVQVIRQTRQTKTIVISLPAQQPIYYTTVYTSNISAERNDLRAELLHLYGALNLENTNWMIGGDFNQIMYPTEHSSAAVVVPDNQMYNFQDCLLQAVLFDLRYNGPSHSWTNKQPSDPIGKKLDRLLVNCNIISAYPHVYSLFLPNSFSDHCPCLVDLAFTLPTAGTKPYKIPKIPNQTP